MGTVTYCKLLLTSSSRIENTPKTMHSTEPDRNIDMNPWGVVSASYSTSSSAMPSGDGLGGHRSSWWHLQLQNALLLLVSSELSLSLPSLLPAYSTPLKGLRRPHLFFPSTHSLLFFFFFFFCFFCASVAGHVADRYYAQERA